VGKFNPLLEFFFHRSIIGAIDFVADYAGSLPFAN
jgi:hypothetical protein